MYTVVSKNYLDIEDSNFSVAIINRNNMPFISPLLEEINQFPVSEVLLFNSRINTKKEWAPIKEIWTKSHHDDQGEVINPGELVNIAIRESRTPYVLIVWNDMRFVHTDLSSRLFLKLEEKGNLCTIPQIYSGQNDNLYKLPVITKPIYDNQGFHIEHSMGLKNDQKTFIPVEYIGFYNRQRFLNLGGYDNRISDPYWQKADFAMRAAMWNEQIVYSPAISVYSHDISEKENEDMLDLSSKLFALKCLLPQMKKSGITLSYSKLSTLMGVPDSLAIFKDIKQFLKDHNFRFHYDAEHVTDHWLGNQLK